MIEKTERVINNRQFRDIGNFMHEKQNKEKQSRKTTEK